MKLKNFQSDGWCAVGFNVFLNFVLRCKNRKNHRGNRILTAQPLSHCITLSTSAKHYTMCSQSDLFQLILSSPQSNYGGRISVFQQSIPSVGPGKLQSREDPNSRAGQKVDTALINASTDYYKKMALESITSQVCKQTNKVCEKKQSRASRLRPVILRENNSFIM